MCVFQKSRISIWGCFSELDSKKAGNLNIKKEKKKEKKGKKGKKGKKKKEKKGEPAGSDPEMLAWQAVQLQASCPDSISPILPYCC